MFFTVSSDVQFHVVTKEMIYVGMVLLKYLPMFMVDVIILILSKLKFGDLSKHGIIRPKRGPFITKETKDDPRSSTSAPSKRSSQSRFR